jgi:hypothetical protein
MTRLGRISLAGRRRYRGPAATRSTSCSASTLLMIPTRPRSFYCPACAASEFGRRRPHEELSRTTQHVFTVEPVDD